MKGMFGGGGRCGGRIREALRGEPDARLTGEALGEVGEEVGEVTSPLRPWGRRMRASTIHCDADAMCPMLEHLSNTRGIG